MQQANALNLPQAAPVSVFIGIGANLGDPAAAVRAAIAAIAAETGWQLVRQSSLYGSTPVDAGGDDYVNAVVEVQTSHLTPLQVLEILQRIEQAAGRQRPYRNAPRTLDLDVLLYGDLQDSNPTLTLPHPRMWERAFVLVPLSEIAPQRVNLAQLDAVRDQGIWRRAGA